MYNKEKSNFMQVRVYDDKSFVRDYTCTVDDIGFSNARGCQRMQEDTVTAVLTNFTVNVPNFFEYIPGEFISKQALT